MVLSWWLCNKYHVIWIVIIRRMLVDYAVRIFPSTHILETMRTEDFCANELCFWIITNEIQWFRSCFVIVSLYTDKILVARNFSFRLEILHELTFIRWILSSVALVKTHSSRLCKNFIANEQIGSTNFTTECVFCFWLTNGMREKKTTGTESSALLCFSQNRLKNGDKTMLFNLIFNWTNWCFRRAFETVAKVLRHLEKFVPNAVWKWQICRNSVCLLPFNKRLWKFNQIVELHTISRQ